MENVLNTIFLGKRIGRKIIRTVMDAIGGVAKILIYAVGYVWFYSLYLLARPYFVPNRPCYRRFRRFSTTAFDGSVRDPQELDEVESTLDMDPEEPVQVIFSRNIKRDDDESGSIDTLEGSTDSSEERRQVFGDHEDRALPFIRFVPKLEGDDDVSTYYTDSD